MPVLLLAQQHGMHNMNIAKTKRSKGFGERVAYDLNVSDTLVTFVKGQLMKQLFFISNIKIIE